MDREVCVAGQLTAAALAALAGTLSLVPELENGRQLRYCKGKALEVPFSGRRKATMTHRLLRRSIGASTGALALLATWQTAPLFSRLASTAGESAAVTQRCELVTLV